MIKKLPILLFTFCAIQGLFAQSYEKRRNSRILEPAQLNFNLFSPGFDIEFRLFKNQTVSTSFLVAAATPQEGYIIAPAWNSRYRYYYNLNSRTRNNKNVSGNSGDYIAASYSIFITDFEIAGNIDVNNFDLRFAGLIYGIQRSYENGFRFDASLGAGFYLGEGINDGVGPSINLTIGWNPWKKKKKKAATYLIPN